MKRASTIKSGHPKFIGMLIFYLITFFQGNLLFSQNFNSKVKAVLITNDVKDDILEITGTAKNLTEENYSLHYELSVIVSGGGNSSKNSQTGRFTLQPFESKNLSQTSISVDTMSRTIILLLLYNLDNEIIGTDRIVYDINEEERKEKAMSYQKRNEGIELKGMVTENTKTKAGKDFYDYFYQSYSLSPEKGGLIHIEEAVSFGRTTRILVKVGDRVVYQFFAQPKLDFLQKHAEAALRQVYRYFEYLKNRSENITQY